MIDYDDEEVRWWMREIEHAVQVMQSECDNVTVESVVRDLHDVYGVQGTPPSDELHEMCEYYLQRYSNPFDGLYYAPSDLKFLTESEKSALLKAVTAKSELLKSHVLEVDAFLKQLQQGSNVNL
jgi:hypothetical protein